MKNSNSNSYDREGPNKLPTFEGERFEIWG